MMPAEYKYAVFYRYDAIFLNVPCKSVIHSIIYHMLSTGEVWNPSDLYKVDMPVPLKEKQKE
jgi:hypothetical protein